MNVVITQSMLFPWVGLLEQVKLADVLVHYDDVQLSKGFINRVQIKTQQGIKWLTVPLKNPHARTCIDAVQIDESQNWRKQHRDKLLQAYSAAPYCNDMLELIDQTYELPVDTLADVSRNSMLALAGYFGVDVGTQFVNSKDLNIQGKGSQRLLDIVKKLEGDTYITGHGARNYLEHALFEQSGIDVQYMQYECKPYQQLHGEFTPYVTGLDLVANYGRCGAAVMNSRAVNWREFLNESP